MRLHPQSLLLACAPMALGLFHITPSALAQLDLGQEEVVQASGVDLVVPGFSDPSVFDWNADGLFDLVVGDGDSALGGKVRFYENTGSAGAPQFGAFSYAQSYGSDLYVPGCG